MRNQIKKAFTLVELIVVVTILAVLSAIGFVAYSGYLAGTRDTNRISQLKSISDGLEMYRTKHSLPLPEDYVEVQASGAIIAYQGYVGKNVLETIEYTSEGKDPKDGTYFSYYLTKDKKYYQLMAYLEESDNLQVNTKLSRQRYRSAPTERNKLLSPFFKGSSLKGGGINQAQAIDYTSRYPTVYGKKLGILTDINNAPIQEVNEVVNSGYLDVVNTDKEFITRFKDNEKIEGTGAVLAQVNPKASCKRIKELKGSNQDGIYEINPEGGNNKFKVYCDMTEGGMTDFLMGEGNFINGKGIFTEYESNPINNIVKIDTPIKSGYAIHQYGNSSSEYKIHFPDINKCKKGYYITMRLWDADNLSNIYHIFHHRFIDSSGGRHYLFYNGENSATPIPKILDTITIGGKTWYLKEVKGKIDADIVDFKWYIGYKSEDPKDLFFTGVRLNCMPY